jgi:hypothetical protein
LRFKCTSNSAVTTLKTPHGLGQLRYFVQSVIYRSILTIILNSLPQPFVLFSFGFPIYVLYSIQMYIYSSSLLSCYSQLSRDTLHRCFHCILLQSTKLALRQGPLLSLQQMSRCHRPPMLPSEFDCIHEGSVTFVTLVPSRLTNLVPGILRPSQRPSCLTYLQTLSAPKLPYVPSDPLSAQAASRTFRTSQRPSCLTYLETLSAPKLPHVP